MSERKSRPKAISERAKNLIIQYSLQDTNQPRDIVANILRREIRQLGELPPTKETLKKAISKARNQPESPLDKPWHLGLMHKPEYNIPAEALLYICLLRDFLCGHLEPPLNTDFPPISIRQAIWVARLYPWMEVWAKEKHGWSKAYTVGGGKGDEKEMCWLNLYEWSKTYAEYERICQLAGTPFDTTELDKRLRVGTPFIASVKGGGEYPGIFVQSKYNELPNLSLITKKDGEK